MKWIGALGFSSAVEYHLLCYVILLCTLGSKILSSWRSSLPQILIRQWNLIEFLSNLDS